MAVRDFFETSQHCVIVEGAALYDNMASKLGGIGYFDDLVKRVFDDRVGESGGNVRDLSPFFLCLFDFGIHEYRTTGTKINGMLCV